MYSIIYLEGTEAYDAWGWTDGGDCTKESNVGL